MHIDIISLFPGFFEGPLKSSILGRAVENKLITVNCVDLRQFGEGARRKVDEKPYGGGPGMLIMPGPLSEAIKSVMSDQAHVVYLSPQGKPLKSKECERFATYKHLILICGHYEGIDERIIEFFVDEEVSIGDFILTSGMPAAICLIDALARFIPGVLGDEKSNQTETFKAGAFEGPQYTRPPEFEGHEVPSVLMNGDHAKIAAWREKKALEKMGKIRPDLIDSGVKRSNYE